MEIRDFLKAALGRDENVPRALGSGDPQDAVKDLYYRVIPRAELAAIDAILSTSESGSPRRASAAMFEAAEATPWQFATPMTELRPAAERQLALEFVVKRGENVYDWAIDRLLELTKK